ADAGDGARAGAAEGVEREGGPRPGDDLPEVPGQGAGTEVRQRAGAGGGPGALAARRADRGPARGENDAAVALVPAQPGPGRKRNDSDPGPHDRGTAWSVG